MKHKKLPSLLALSISLELVLSPLPAFAENKTQNVMSTISGAMNLGMQAYNTLGGQGQQQMDPRVANDMANLAKQQTATADKHFTYQNMQKIPGLMEYIAKKNQDAAKSGGKAINPLALNCTTLPTTLYESNNEVCRNREVNGLAGDPKIQADEAFVYYKQYVEIEKTYQNYSVRSNVGGQSFGTGCMQDAMAVLQGFFAYRLEQMDTMVTELEAANAKFEEQSEMDLKAIRENSAVLNGENSKFATEFKNSDLFDYGKRFEDPACNSMLSKDDMDKFGKENGGLMAIEKKLKLDLGTTPEGSKYSPESYLKNNADIVKDIKAMADKVAEQAGLNFGSFANNKTAYSNFLGTVGGDVSSESGANVALNKGFFSDLQTKFAKTSNALNDEASLIGSELGAGSAAAMEQLGNIENDANFEAEVSSLENKIKGQCVKSSGIETALSRIYDPTLSKSANKHSSEQIKKRIKVILDDVTISPEKKLAELQAIESQGGSRYEMKMDADYETQEVKADGTIVKKKVNAAGKVTPGSFFTDVIKNCETQFQVNKLKNKLSGKEAIKKLRTLKKEYQKASRQHSKDIKDEIVKKMIDCGGNSAVASSSTVGSCTPAKLNMGAPGFCAKAAFSCSSNMKSCTDKAAKFVKEIKDDRLKRTNNYNNNVESTRKQMVNMFDATLVKYMKEAESLRGMFGTGFVPPKGIERDIKGDEKFDAKFNAAPDALEIKDPKKYLEMVKNNMDNLRKQVEAQQQSIMSDDGPLFKHIQETQKNYKEQVIAKSSQHAKDCLAAYNSYKAIVKAQKEGYDKVQGELGEKTAEFCGRYEDVMVSHVAAGCKDGVGDVSDEMIKAAGKAGNAWTAAEAKRMRREMQVYCDSHGNQRDKDGKSTASGADACLDSRADVKEAIGKLKKLYKGIPADTNNEDAWAMICGVVTSGPSDEVCGHDDVAATTTVGGTNTAASIKIRDCSSKVEAAVLSVYKNFSNPSSSGQVDVADSDDLLPTQSTGDVGSFCNAGNNSGPFNTKGNILQGGNPGVGQAGASGFAY